MASTNRLDKFITYRYSLSLRKLRHFLISKTCFDVTNIIVSYKIFEKPLGLYHN